MKHLAPHMCPIHHKHTSLFDFTVAVCVTDTALPNTMKSQLSSCLLLVISTSVLQPPSWTPCCSTLLHVAWRQHNIINWLQIWHSCIGEQMFLFKKHRWCQPALRYVLFSNNVKLIARLASLCLMSVYVTSQFMTIWLHVSRQKIGHMTLTKYSYEPLEMLHGCALPTATRKLTTKHSER